MPEFDADFDELGTGPENLDRGQSNAYVEDGRLVKEVNVDGTVYRNYYDSGDNPDPNNTFNNFEFTEDSIGGSNFTISTGDNAVFVEDDNSNIRAIFGQITQGSYGLKTLDVSGNEIFGLYGSTANIAGWNLATSSISTTSASGTKTISLEAGDQPRLNLASGSTTVFKAGMLDGTKIGMQINNSSGTEVIRIDDSGTTSIAGWSFDAGLFKSATTGARIELNATKNRVSILDSNNTEKVVMGYLNGLAKNDTTGDWGSNDYGFWALAGDSLTIDGDMTYESGDWMVENDASLRIRDGNDKEVLRLGTRNGTKGLFIGSDIENVTPLAEYSDTQILIGNASGQHLKYTTSSGLEITGDVTVSGDTSNSHYETFQLGVNGTSVSYLPTSQYTIFAGTGGLTQKQTSTGMGFYDTSITTQVIGGSPTSDGWDSGFIVTKEFKRADVPVMTWDVRLDNVGVNSEDNIQGAYDNRFEMIGWNDQIASAEYAHNMIYGAYFAENNIYWWKPNQSDGTIEAGSSVGSNWRIVIQLTSGGAVGRAYKNGDFTTPFSTHTFTNNGSTSTFYTSALQRNGNSPKLNHQQLAVGNVSPSVPTRISGGLITTGKIQSTDAKTFFDLDNDDLRVNDGTNDRVVIGKLANNNYGMRVAFDGQSASGSPSLDQLAFSTEFTLPKYQIVYMDGRELRQTKSETETPYPTLFRKSKSIIYSGSLNNESSSGYVGNLALVNPPNKWDGSDTNNSSALFGEMKIAHPYFHDRSIKFLRFNCLASTGTGVVFGVTSFIGGNSHTVLQRYTQNTSDDFAGSNIAVWSNNYTTGWGLAPNHNHNSNQFNISNNLFVKGSAEAISNIGQTGNYNDEYYSLSVRIDVTSLTHGSLYTCIASIGGYSLPNGNTSGNDTGRIIMPMTTAHGYEMTSNTLTSFGQ